MKITRLAVQNYKSLRDVELELSDFTVVIGANGSGKSNLASAFDFLGDVYQNGLEFAVAKKGGYENIAYRKVRRTKSPISFSIDVNLSGPETARLRRHFIFRNVLKTSGQDIRIRHQFSLHAARTSIRSDYSIAHEELTIFANANESSSLFEKAAGEQQILQITRIENSVELKATDEKIRKDLNEYLRYFSDIEWEESLFDLFLRRLIPPLTSILGAIAVHQFSPKISRSPGSPSPQPRLTGYGENLPSLVDWLKRHHTKRWRSVESAMRDILPDLEEISIEYLHTKQLGLFFKEKSFGRAWTAEDVSDGTIQTLAILSAIADPRNSLMFLEEPENSVHPWIVRQIANQLKKLSSQTQIVVTTHSPLILNIVEPKSVWVCHKDSSYTQIDSLPALAPDVVSDWEKGVDRLFELIDSGSVREAVPISNT